MTFVHGKNTYISLDANDLSAYTTESEFTRTADSHDVTTYGKDDYCYSGGLRGSEFNMKGIYDNTATTGPRDVIRPLIGTVVTLIRRPDGTGAGKAQDTVDMLVTRYVESSPVADMVTWSCDGQCSDAVDSTAQSA